MTTYNDENSPVVLYGPNWPEEIPQGFVLLIDKPLGWTSFDVVNKVRHWLSKRAGVKRIKLGHAGTLDPLATGLLILCAGNYTRRIEQFQGLEKAYTGAMTFGAVTASFDLEKPVEPLEDAPEPTEELLEQARQKLVGHIAQFPPVFSAVKVEGKRLYAHARKGNGEVELQARQVTITRFDLSPLYAVPDVDIAAAPVNIATKGHPIWKYPDFKGGLRSDFIIECGKGTYIRSMAFDMGELTGCGAYLSALRRTRIGPYSVDDAWDLNTLIEGLKT